MSDRVTVLPIYLQAKTKDELIAKMIKNNLGKGKHFKYFSPIKDGSNWVVWYYADVKDEMIREAINVAKPE